MTKHAFRLTKAFDNPKPDRRQTNTVWAMPQWKEGSIWILRNTKTGARLELRGAHGYIEERDQRFRTLREAFEEVELVEEAGGYNYSARDAFRAFMAMAESDAASILANLYYTGQVSMTMLCNADQDVDKNVDDATYENYYT